MAAQFELDLAGVPHLATEIRVDDPHPLGVVVVYEDGTEHEWSGLIALRLRQLLKE